MKHKNIILLITLISLFLLEIHIPIQVESTTSTSIKTNPLIVEIIQRINKSLVFSYHDTLLSFGPRCTGSDNCYNAGEWIYNTFNEMGLETSFHNWKYDGFSCRNIVATLPGNNPDLNTQIIMSAHYDCTSDSLGADDDASGVAAVLATAFVMKDISFNHTIKFITFSGEEVGTYGSFCYARDAYQNGDNIYAVINLDMIGYANSTKGGNILRFHCPGRSWWIGEQSQIYANTYHQYTNIIVETRPNYIGADHQPFVDYGYDGVWIAHHDGYIWANTPKDIPDHLNWTYQLKTTKALAAIVAEFASQPIPIQVMFNNPKEGKGYLFDTIFLPLDLGRYWYNGLRGTTIIIGRTTVAVNIITEYPIDRVIYCLDNNFIVSLNTPPYEWNIQGKHYPLIGKYNLQVYVYTENGEIAFDEMDIKIISLSYQYGN
jgi:hypothetical protein